MLTKRAQVLCEIEAVEGTAETLEDADAFLAFDPKFDPDIEAHERAPVASALSPFPSVFGKRSARLTFAAELVGPGAAGDPIHISDVLKACGVSETLVSETSAIYKPASASVPSVTLGWYMDGKQHKMWGARGTARLLLEAGKPGIFFFDFLGADFSVVDGALAASPSYETNLAPTFQGASLTIDSFGALISMLEIDLGNVLALRPDVNTDSGYKSAVITGRKPVFKFDPEEALVSAEDFFGNWRSGKEMAFTTSIGTGAGKVITITAPKVQYQAISPSDREGQAALDIIALLARDSGDDEWQIAIT